MTKEDILNAEETRFTDNETYRTILARHSVRQYSDRPVEASAVQALLRAAMAAPSGVNRQPWEFIVVTDRGLLNELAAVLPYAKMAAAAPLAIIACGNRDRFLEDEDSTLWVQDLSAATENLLLAAQAFGLGAVWTALYPHLDRMGTVRQLLRLPDNLVAFNLIPVGYPLAPHAPMEKWHPDRIHLNAFGS